MRTYRSPNDTGVALDPVLVTSAEKCEAAHSSSGEELDSEDGVDLANELVADINSSLSHRAAELDIMSAFLNSPCIKRIYSYLEIIGEVVLAIAGRTKEALGLIASSRTLSVGGGRVGVVVGVALRSWLVLGVGSHRGDKCAYLARSPSIVCGLSWLKERSYEGGVVAGLVFEVKMVKVMESSGHSSMMRGPQGSARGGHVGDRMGKLWRFRQPRNRWRCKLWRQLSTLATASC